MLWEGSVRAHFLPLKRGHRERKRINIFLNNNQNCGKLAQNTMSYISELGGQWCLSVKMPHVCASFWTKISKNVFNSALEHNSTFTDHYSTTIYFHFNVKTKMQRETFLTFFNFTAVLKSDRTNCNSQRNILICFLLIFFSQRATTGYYKVDKNNSGNRWANCMRNFRNQARWACKIETFLY